MRKKKGCYTNNLYSSFININYTNEYFQILKSLHQWEWKGEFYLLRLIWTFGGKSSSNINSFLSIMLYVILKVTSIVSLLLNADLFSLGEDWWSKHLCLKIWKKIPFFLCELFPLYPLSSDRIKTWLMVVECDAPSQGDGACQWDIFVPKASFNLRYCV